ncbi:unnamed protein product [Adineta steineri]|uniref:G-protein coupled receptors family 1 profile domain-containing protein n=1 Tax=Adineta steineri TaxID=433720 RepID=A0A819RS00_9BILA|nr:unnamed protein product [Adineta steineri]
MVSVDTLKLITKQLAIYGNSALLISGIISSCANIFVFSRRHLRKSPSSRYILVTSLFDFFNITFSVTTRLMIDGFAFDPFSANSYACPIRTYLAFIFSFCPMSCRCLSIIDRYLCSCRSVLLRNWSSTKVAYRALFINCLFWFLIGIPLLIFTNPITVSVTRIVCNFSNQYFGNYYAYFLNPVAYFVTPSLIMSIFSIGTYKNLRVMIRTPHVGAQRRIEQQFIFMIIIQSVVFTISSLPNGIRLAYTIATSSVQKSTYRVAQEGLFYEVALISYFISSCSSFYIFICLSKDVRSVVLEKIRKRPSILLTTKKNRVGPSINNQLMVGANVNKSFSGTPATVTK